MQYSFLFVCERELLRLSFLPFFFTHIPSHFLNTYSTQPIVNLKNLTVKIKEQIKHSCVCLCWWKGSQRKRKRGECKEERQNRYSRAGTPFTNLQSKRISTTKVKSRGLTASQSLWPGVPQENKRALSSESEGQKHEFLGRQISFVEPWTSQLFKSFFLLQSVHDNGVNIADTVTVWPRRSRRASVLLTVVSSQYLAHV